MSRFAPTLANEFAYATECNLATLSGLLGRKSSSKVEIKRQTSICLRMLTCCRSEKDAIEWGHDLHTNFGRVHKIVMAPNLAEALDKWMVDPTAG